MIWQPYKTNPFLYYIHNNKRWKGYIQFEIILIHVNNVIHNWNICIHIYTFFYKFTIFAINLLFYCTLSNNFHLFCTISYLFNWFFSYFHDNMYINTILWVILSHNHQQHFIFLNIFVKPEKHTKSKHTKRKTWMHWKQQTCMKFQHYKNINAKIK